MESNTSRLIEAPKRAHMAAAVLSEFALSVSPNLRDSLAKTAKQSGVSSAEVIAETMMLQVFA